MDALTDILNTLKLKSSLYFRTELTAPWGVAVPAHGRVARFHIVIRGQCWLNIEGQAEPMLMSNGDLVVIPHGAGHVITDAEGSEVKPLAEVLNEVSYSGTGPLVYGGGGAGCCLVCGEFAFDEVNSHPLLDNLPARLFVKGDESYNTTWLDSAIGFIAHEAASSKAGANAIIDRLSEIILIQVIRATLAQATEQIPFLSAFHDDKINSVLSHIHQDPAADWNVERLGQLVNMSRTAFSNRFASLTKMTPLQYVIFVRLQKASQLLLTTPQSLFSIADSVGYQSEAAFSLAFKRQFGIRPGEYRKQQGQVAA
ncbi:AraC family transcriptional regulator [Endozoicomonas sp. G2_1]|uniref:AraC family transcriptional regulator n=1 Tax=Endozoicomonas sp. G2_1 TaxID=2821091 RepID=UPI001ADCAF40|nr:AraC family transcriptional regulator [Endozoicomonas sp. G2_1]MBO9491463.1 AraC family transcriptional regulator [Endozoicomonas sp. G2_1]